MTRPTWMRKAAAVAVTLVALCSVAGTARAQWTTHTWNYRAINDTITPLKGIDAVNTPGALAFTAESTVVFSVPPGTEPCLFLRVNPAAGDTSTAIRLACEIKIHKPRAGCVGIVTTDSLACTDSASVATWAPWYANTSNNSGSQIDSTGYLTTTGTTPQPGSDPEGLLPGEKLVTFLPHKGTGIGKSNANFGWPSAQWVQFSNGRGDWLLPQFISVRIRCLSGASKPKVTADVVFAQR